MGLCEGELARKPSPLPPGEGRARRFLERSAEGSREVCRGISLCFTLSGSRLSLGFTLSGSRFAPSPGLSLGFALSCSRFAHPLPEGEDSLDQNQEVQRES